jgi:hypothetical protein
MKIDDKRTIQPQAKDEVWREFLRQRKSLRLTVESDKPGPFETLRLIGVELMHLSLSVDALVRRVDTLEETVEHPKKQQI